MNLGDTSLRNYAKCQKVMIHFLHTLYLFMYQIIKLETREMVHRVIYLYWSVLLKPNKLLRGETLD